MQSGFSKGSEMLKASKSISHLRSLHMFESKTLPVIPSEFAKCQVLRVLDMKVQEDNHIKYIGHFCELKYLRIEGGIRKLPEQIGKLQHLQTLDLEETHIEKLPASIVQLQKLVHLLIPFVVSLPDGIENLQALEVLWGIDLYGASVESIYGLGELTKLREVRIWSLDFDEDNNKEGHRTACIHSLSKLLKCSLQSLYVEGLSSSDVIASSMISCGSISPLRRLVLYNEIPTIPSQFASLVNLIRLSVEVGGVGGLEILSSLPMLQSLTLSTDYDIPNFRQVISGQGFQNLRKFNFRSWASEMGLMFEPGAMPKLQRLKLRLNRRWQFIVHGGPVVGLHHLSALKSIALELHCDGAAADVVESLEDDIRAAAVAHPNRPTLEIQRYGELRMKKPDE
uniref:Disease resistance R13L4/SHOC-2-like LRR domain-containing protein n=1 Tax=Oryza punctata TaxID=4537 RepID=A0A0E0JYC2_ORYPU